MTILQIKYFVEIAQSRNFTQTAKRLYISQQAISKQIKALECELGFPLLIRTSRGVELTESAKFLLPKWKQLVEYNDSYIEQAKHIYNADRILVRVGIIDINNVLNPFLKLPEISIDEYSEYEFEYIAATPKKLKMLFENRMLDIMVTFASDAQILKKNIKTKVITEVRLGLVIHKNHPLYTKNTISLSDVEHETMYLIGEEFTENLEERIRTYIMWPNSPPEQIKKVSDQSNMKIALSTGRGFTISYDLFFREDNEFHFHPIPKGDIDDEQFLIAMWRDKVLDGYIDHISNLF